MPQILSSFASCPPTEGWVEEFVYTPSDRSIVLEKGMLFAFVSLSKGSDKRAILSRTVFDHLVEDYYVAGSTNILESIKEAFVSAYELMGEGELYVAVVFETKIIAVAQGGVEIVLYRGGTRVTLLKSEKSQEKAVSGYIKPGDIFVCGTRIFFETLAPPVLLSTVSSRNPTEIAEFIKPLLSVHANGRIGAWFLKVQETFHAASLPLAEEAKEDEAPIAREEEISDPSEIEEKIAELITPKRAPNVEGRLFTDEALHTEFPHQPSLSDKPLYVKDPSQLSFSAKRKTPLLLGSLFVLFLIISIFFGRQKLIEKQKEEAFQSKVTAIEQKLEESKTLANINPQKARELFGEAKAETEALLDDVEHKDQVQELQQKENDLQKEILGEESANLQLLVDLSLLSEGFVSSSITSDANNLYVFDNENKRVSKVSLSSKRAEIVAGPGALGNVISIASFGDSVYGLGNRGIYKLPGEVRLIGDEYSDGILLSYAGNLYVVDKKESAIYRYGGGSGPKSEWLTDGVEPNFSNAISGIVDGTIWVLRESGELLRFSNGNPVVFSLYGAIPEITNPKSFYTDVDSDNLYVLDPDNARIVIATKGGEFVSQYVSEEFKNARFIVASEKDKKIFVVMESKVYVMAMGE